MVNTAHPAQRPGAVTVISVVLAFLAAADFGNAVAWNQSEVVAAASRYGLAVGGWVHTSILVISAVAALATAVGLWRMAPWARPSFIVWCFTVVAFDGWAMHSGLLRSPGTTSGEILVLGTIVILGGIYWFLAQALRWSARSGGQRKGP